MSDKIFVPDEDDIQFHVLELKSGSYVVTCAECGATQLCSHFPLVLKWEKKHRDDHFGYIT